MKPVVSRTVPALLVKWTGLVLAAAVFFGIGRWAGTTPELRVGLQRAQLGGGGGQYGYQPRYTSSAGTQLVMIYVAAAACAWSNNPALPGAVERIKLSLVQQAEQNGLSFKALAVALDQSPQAGIDHLKRFGKFDEVAAGYGSANSVAMHYFWSAGLGSLLTPQVVVYTREFVVPASDRGERIFREFDLKLVATKVGLDEILQWSDGGARLPAGFP